MISTEALDSLVDAISDAERDARQWPDTMDRLAAAASANVADLTVADPSRSASTIFSAGTDP
jgi:hypothetical protein